MDSLCVKLRCIFTDLFYENGAASLTRFMAVTSFFSFLFISFYLIFKGESWGNYETFASMTAGGGAVMQISNKFINSKYNNSGLDEFGQRKKTKKEPASLGGETNDGA